jgi:hypothetical protein
LIGELVVKDLHIDEQFCAIDTAHGLGLMKVGLHESRRGVSRRARGYREESLAIADVRAIVWDFVAGVEQLVRRKILGQNRRLTEVHRPGLGSVALSRRRRGIMGRRGLAGPQTKDFIGNEVADFDRLIRFDDTGKIGKHLAVYAAPLEAELKRGEPIFSLYLHGRFTGVFGVIRNTYQPLHVIQKSSLRHGGMRPAIIVRKNLFDRFDIQFLYVVKRLGRVKVLGWFVP